MCQKSCPDVAGQLFCVYIKTMDKSVMNDALFESLRLWRIGLFTALLLLPALTLSAQQAADEVKKLAYENPYLEANQDAIRLLNASTDNEDVSFMLFDHWRPMETLGKDSTLLHVDSANYQIRLDKIVFMNQGKMYELYANKVVYARVGDRVFIRRDYMEKGRRVPHFFEVLVAGEYALVCKYDMTEEIRNESPLGLEATKHVEYTKGHDYYYLKSNSNTPEPLPRKKRDFIMIFKKHRPELVVFAKEHKVSLHNEDDLREIFTYYNTLVKS